MAKQTLRRETANTEAPAKKGGKVSGKTRKLSPKFIRISIVVWAVLIVGLLVFAEIVRPNQDAVDYTKRLDSASKPLETCFNELTKTTELQIYYAPDIKISDKQSDLSRIRKQIADCRTHLGTFDDAAHSLMGFQWAGYTDTYRDAKVNQRQAYDVVGQSTDVLNQYDKVASFLSAYYNHIEAFLNYTQALSTLDTAVVTNANIKALNSQAADLRNRANQISGLEAPTEFNDTKQQTSKMFYDAADGFEAVVGGYRTYADTVTTQGFNQVDDAVKTYESKVINLPFEQLIASYVPKQVQQLPGKVENLLASQSE